MNEEDELFVLNDTPDLERKMQLNKIKKDLLIQSFAFNTQLFYKQNVPDIRTLFDICLPAFQTEINNRTQEDKLLISLYIYQMKKFMRLFIDNIIDENNIINNKFYDSLLYISSNIFYSKFHCNRLLMRYGDEGSRFYLLLKGEVAILIPIKKILTLTVHEYRRYIILLIIYKEYKILREVLKENFPVYNIGIEYSNDNNYDFMDSEDKNLTKIKKLFELYLTEEEKRYYLKYVLKSKNIKKEHDDGFFISPREYINRLKQYSDFDYEELNNKLEEIEGTENIELNNLKNFLIYEYHKVTELNTGETFGDLALSTSSSKRTASIITINDCHFGYFNEYIYTKSIKEYQEKSRKKLICYLCNVPLLDNFGFNIMEKRYYNNFVFKTIKRNENILEVDTLNKNVIILKEGLYEVSFEGSINDICDLKKLMI